MRFATRTSTNTLAVQSDRQMASGDSQELLGQFSPRENFRKSKAAKRLTLASFRVFSTYSIQRITRFGATVGHMNTQCPNCKSQEIVEGELRGDQPTEAGSPAFYVKTTRSKFFWTTEPCVYPDKSATICLSCGLLWTHVDCEKAKKLHQKHGS